MSDEAKPNDAVRAVKAGKDIKKGNWVKAGVAAGVGSAAIVAALLYANRGGTRTPKREKKKD
jgi:hypothetical protein